MEILVAGGTRYMGRYLVWELLNRGHQVTILSRGQTEDPFGDRVQRIRGDRYQQQELAKIFRGKSYDVICDSLAYTSNDVMTLLEAVSCKRYVQISSASVYEEWHLGMKEEEYQPELEVLMNCQRGEVPYSVGKRQAEAAIAQRYGNLSHAMVRFPFVLGPDDYTGRLEFYVEHIRNSKGFFTDNPEAGLAFVHGKEAGVFLAHLVESDYCGPINGASYGRVSIREIAEYLFTKVGGKMVMEDQAKEAPYNLEQDYDLCLKRAESTGYVFSELKDWFWDLVDYYIK